MSAPGLVLPSEESLAESPSRRPWVRLPAGGWAGLGIVAFFMLMAAVGPLLTPYSLHQTFPTWLPPGPTHWFGTDNYGQDILTQLIYGSRSSIVVGTLAGLLGATVGVTVGLTAGYLGGAVGEFLMRIVDVLLVIPTLALLILIAAFLPSAGVVSQILVIGFLSWLWMARSIRSQTLSERSRGYVDVARVVGLSQGEIMFREIMPNVLPIAISNLVLVITASILAQASLSFLGIGDASTVSWGQMLSLAYTDNAVSRNAWWWLVPPGLSIALLAYGFVLVGNAVLDIYTASRRAD